MNIFFLRVSYFLLIDSFKNLPLVCFKKLSFYLIFFFSVMYYLFLGKSQYILTES